MERLQSPGFRPGNVSSVLVFVNSDSNLDADLQHRLLTLLPTMQACYATNLMRPTRPDIFYPIPLGLASHHYTPYDRVVYEPVLRRFRASAPRWAERSSQLLMFAWESLPKHAVTLGRKKHRAQLLAHLMAKQFARDVRPIERRVSFEEALAMTGQHKFVLSAPGMGYDAFRTWETLAMGSIPVVLALPSMDQRLFDGFPVVRLPANISQITPAMPACGTAGSRAATPVTPKCTGSTGARRST